MTKQLTLYIAIAFATILGGCQTGYDEPDADLRQPLELSISSAVNIIPSNEPTRSYENQYARITYFEAGDVVGLTVLGTDDEGKDILLADNVPYKFDGTKWDVDTDSVPESRRVYFEKSMHTYIVYYPYKKKADGCKSIEDIKERCFPYQVDQTTKEAYNLSDPVAWSDNNPGQKKLNVTLQHLRNAIMIDPKVRWKLTNDETITYQPLREALEVFVIRNAEGDSLRVYHAPDSTYRYILSDGYDDVITWRYAYRYHKFIGSCKVAQGAIGTRYVQDELVDMGVYDSSNALELDCYCTDPEGNGYILPWDAVSLLRKEKDQRRCIGVVHYLGHNIRDGLDYSDTPVGTEKCHGYVLALTDTHQDFYGYEWDINISNKYHEYVGTNKRPSQDQVNRDWNGYENCQAIKAYVKYYEETRKLKLASFPAEYSCFNYGSDWQEGLEAPRNTTEWFLPSDGILHHYLNYNLEKLRATDRDAIINKRFEYIKLHTDDEAPYKQYIRPLSYLRPYHSSTEIDSGTLGANVARLVFGLNLANLALEENFIWKYNYSLVRPVLVF